MAPPCHSVVPNGRQSLCKAPRRSSIEGISCNRDNTFLQLAQMPEKHICLDCDKRAQQIQRIKNSRSTTKKLKVDRGQCIQPPVILDISFRTREERRYIVGSPHLFVVAELLRVNDDGAMTLMPCIGTTVSSLNLTKVAKTTEKRGSFVFSDIIPQFKENLPGQYKFRFTLMDVRVDEVLDAAYALSITDMLSPAFEVEFVHKVPAALESTQLTRDLREGGVNLKLKKKPKARANKNKISWSIEGPIDSTPQPLSVMGPAYGLINGPTEGISFNSMSVRDRIKISTRSLPVPTSSHQDLLNQHTMAYSQHPLTTTTTSAMEYPQASATMMPRAYHAPAHGQHFGQIPLPMSYPSSDLMAPDEYWRPPNTDIQYPHVTATAVNGASTSTSGQYTGTMATADSGPPASTNGQYTGMMATADSGPPTSTNGQYTGRMATADSRPPTSANGHFPDIGSVGAYGVPAHMTGQYADAMPAIGYGPTINGNDQYSVSFWPGCYPDGAEEEGEQYL